MQTHGGGTSHEQRQKSSSRIPTSAGSCPRTINEHTAEAIAQIEGGSE